MRLGISSWTYPWAVGVPGFPLPDRPMRLAGLLNRASALKVGVVQIADNLPIHELDLAELRDAQDQAADLGLGIEVGTRGIEPDHLLRYLQLAIEFKSELLRTLLPGPEQIPSIDEAARKIRQVLPEFEAEDITLCFENHEKYSCQSLAALVQKLESKKVGICLDTVNSLGTLETLETVVELLAPLTANLHVKDFVIERVPQMMGFEVKGAPAGSGQLSIPWLLERVPSDVSAILEQWPPLKSSAQASVATEEDWAEQGIGYLRSCGCT